RRGLPRAPRAQGAVPRALHRLPALDDAVRARQRRAPGAPAGAGQRGERAGLDRHVHGDRLRRRRILRERRRGGDAGRVRRDRGGDRGVRDPSARYAIAGCAAAARRRGHRLPPSSVSAAGAISRRTSVTSTSTALARPMPVILIVGSASEAKPRKTAIMIAPAAVTIRRVPAHAAPIASRWFAWRPHSSRTRESRNTL